MRPALSPAAPLAGLALAALLAGCPDGLDARFGRTMANTGTGGEAGSSAVASSSVASASSSSGMQISVLCPTYGKLCDGGDVCCYTQPPPMSKPTYGTCIGPSATCDQVRLSCSKHVDCPPGEICCAHWTTDGGTVRHFTDVSCSPACVGANSGWVCGDHHTNNCPAGETMCDPIIELQSDGGDGYGICAP
jgi:hypothetical protein